MTARELIKTLLSFNLNNHVTIRIRKFQDYDLNNPKLLDIESSVTDIYQTVEQNGEVYIEGSDR